MHPTSYPTHIPFIPNESTLSFLRYSNFNILPWKSKVKVMGEGKVWSQNVSLAFYRLTSLSFQVNQSSHSWDMTFSKFDLESPRSRSWKRWTLKVTSWVQHSIDSHPFHSMSISHPIHKIRLFQNLTLKIQGQGHGWGERWKSEHGSNILSTHIPFIPCQSAIPFLIQCKPDISRLVGSMERYRDISESAIYRATVMSQNQTPFSSALWTIMGPLCV